MLSNLIVCPECSTADAVMASCVRQGDFKGRWIIDVGYQCPRCKHKFGFDLFSSPGLWFELTATSITCGQCGRTSHNPNDVENRYCGACHVFLAPGDPINHSR